jgi:hypothetical protein
MAPGKEHLKLNCRFSFLECRQRALRLPTAYAPDVDVHEV